MTYGADGRPGGRVLRARGARLFGAGVLYKIVDRDHMRPTSTLQQEVRDYVKPGTSALFMIIVHMTEDKAPAGGQALTSCQIPYNPWLDVDSRPKRLDIEPGYGPADLDLLAGGTSLHLAWAAARSHPIWMMPLDFLWGKRALLLGRRALTTRACTFACRIRCG
jgi:hypothetical protein